MSEQENSSSYLDNMSLEEVKNSFGEGYVYQRKQQQLIEKRRKKKKLEERNGLLVILAIFTFFVVAMLNDSSTSSNSGYQEKPCVDKHKEDYQAYLYCVRMQNFNR
jgi:hypothetical protein